MKDVAIATVVSAVAALGVAIVALVCTRRVSQMFDEAREDARLGFARTVEPVPAEEEAQ